MRLKSLFVASALLGSSFQSRAQDQVGQFKNESEAGIVLVSGNSTSKSINLKQGNSYENGKSLIKLSGAFLRTSSLGVESAKSWDASLRLGRNIHAAFSIFAGQNVEANRFAGYDLRFNSDIGAKYSLIKEEAFTWSAEGGYRFTSEDRVTPPSRDFHKARLFSEATRNWSEGVSTRLGLEFLHNFSEVKDWQLNAELSVSAILNSMFSIKTAYSLKYANESAPKENTDSVFTTSLVAKF